MPSAYLDHAASTPVRPAAAAAAAEVLTQVPGNPSGQHRWARDARRRLDDARDAIAEVIGARPSEIVFTSGGTEADNLAVVGVAGATTVAGARPSCPSTDHHAVIEPVRSLGGSVFDVGGRAVLDPEEIARQLRAAGPISVVSLALVNNELGVVQPVADLVSAVRSAAPNAVVHIDAVAAAGWLDLVPVTGSVDLVALSGHKVGGPKGIGVLVVRDGTALAPLLRGGAQERERRAGTPDVAGAVAMAVAVREAADERTEAAARVAAQRDRLRAGILAAVGDRALDTVELAGGGPQAPHLLHLSCRGVHREVLLLRLDRDGVAASAGSSCASGAPERSHVVDALGIPEGWADGSLRLSLGWSTTDAEIDHALAVIPPAIVELAGTAPEGAAP